MTDSERAAIVAQLLAEQRAKWHALVEKYHVHELYKADAAELLRLGCAPTREALPMLADIILGCGQPLKSTKRDKHILVNGEPVPAKDFVLGFIDGSVDAGRCNLQTAKELASKRFGVSMRAIEQWRRNKP